jgi:hypothetical protein
MKSLIFATFVFCILAISTTAQNTDTTVVITFKETVHDYGTIALGGNGTCEFKFTNPGKSPLILSAAQASCGCTVPEWTKEPVQPGKEGIIKVTYNTNIPGSFQKSVTVTSNAKNSPLVLIIKGTVEQPKQ